MKKILMCTIAFACLSVIRVEAFDWSSILNIFSSAAENQAQETVVTSFSDLEKQMAAIDSSVQASFLDVVSKTSGWLETRSIKSQLKKSDITSVISDYTTTYLNSNKDAIVKKLKKMSEKDKTAVINDIKTITDNGQKYLLLAANTAKTATNTLKTAQNISEVSNTVANINKTAVELRSRASAVYNFAKQVKSIANTAGVTIN